MLTDEVASLIQRPQTYLKAVMNRKLRVILRIEDCVTVFGYSDTQTSNFRSIKESNQQSVTTLADQANSYPIRDFSVDNNKIKQMLDSHEIKLVSTVRFGRIWDFAGGLAVLKCGDRYEEGRPDTILLVNFTIWFKII